MLPQLSSQAETDYLKRIKLRATLQQIAPDSVPQPSNFEAMLMSCNKQLNDLYKTGDSGDAAEKVTARAKLEILYSRMGTTNLFNIANTMATARLQKQSIAEIDALIKNPSTSFDVIFGKEEDSTVSALRASKVKMNEIKPPVRANLFGVGATKAQMQAYVNALPAD